jgi:hypothetical protein
VVWQASEQFGTSSSLGNDPGFRTWVGDVESVPAYQAWPLASLPFLVTALQQIEPEAPVRQ